MEKVGQCINYLQQLVKKDSDTDSDDDPNRPNKTPPKFPKVNLKRLDIPPGLLDHVLGTIFGNCIGDAIGLITEFLIKPRVTQLFKSHKHFEYKMKDTITVKEGKFFHQFRFPTADWTDDSDQMILILLSLIDNAGEMFGKHKHFEYRMKDITAEKHYHQYRFPTGDWTDDSDQMILILQSLTDNAGEIVPLDFGKRMQNWCKSGFPELGDTGGMGCGATTFAVLHHRDFEEDPHLAAYKVWMDRDCNAAPNGCIMRTSILGVHNHHDIDRVINNTVALCKTTHADPRCIASTVAVTTCIAMMLQDRHRLSDGSYDTLALTNDAYEYAKPFLNAYKDHKHTDSKKTIPEYPAEDLHKFMTMENIEDLDLDENGKIGYVYKCLGAGFWAFRQNDFRKAIEALTREGGDADTNGAVAGALLGCKLGYKKLPKSWKEELIHKNWLEGHIFKYIELGIMNSDPGTNVDTGASSSTPSNTATPKGNTENELSTKDETKETDESKDGAAELSPKDETQVEDTSNDSACELGIKDETQVVDKSNEGASELGTKDETQGEENSPANESAAKKDTSDDLPVVAKDTTDDGPVVAIDTTDDASTVAMDTTDDASTVAMRTDKQSKEECNKKLQEEH